MARDPISWYSDFMKSQQPSITLQLDVHNRIILYRERTPIMVIRPQDWIIETVHKVLVSQWLAWQRFKEQNVQRFAVHDVISLQENTWHLVDEHSRLLATVTAYQPRPDAIEITIGAVGEDVNRLGFHWWSASSEILYGFGEYGNGPMAHPGRWATWAEEGPVGLGPLSPWLRWTGRVPLPHGHRSTYAPSPMWISTLNYGAWLHNTQRIDWALKGARHTVRVWSSQVKMTLVVGSTLKDVLHARSERLGRGILAPPWVFGPWVDSVQGSQNALSLAHTLRDGHIPATAIWIEDWTGSWENPRRFWMRPLSHQVDERLYPDLAELTTKLHQEGLKVLGYFCPEVAEDTGLYREARDNDHLVVDQEGRPVDVDILGHHHGELDLTRPQTRQWVKDVLFGPLYQLGFDGWMADFGEHLPVQSCLADGTSGWTTHNRYPELWQSLHKEFWEECRGDGDYTFFVRSAGLHTPSLAPVMWGGDSDTDWDKADGLQTVVPQALSAGLVGNILWGTDIAGYMTFGLTHPSTKELYCRWTELAALLPIMRTHHGTARPRNWHWNKDMETRKLFTRYARLHALLLPYFFDLMVYGCESGLPLVRPLWLEYPDQHYEAVNDQYLLGPHLLVAPVTKPKRRRHLVVFPPGRWHNWWNPRQVIEGPTRITVEAPIDILPLWLRQGSFLPVWEGMRTPTDPSAGFFEHWNTPQEVQASGKFLTLLYSPGEAHGVAQSLIHLPTGRLDISTESGNDAQPHGVPPSADAHHAPWLTVDGRHLQLAPEQTASLLGRGWTWHGAEPLHLIWRVLW